MSEAERFQSAMDLIDAGDVDALQSLLQLHPELAQARDEGNATLLIRLMDWPGHRPRSADSARVLLQGGAEVDARRNDENGTSLSGALCTEEVDLIGLLLEFGADINAPCGWQSGSVLQQADRWCENWERATDPAVVAIAKMFSEASGRPVPKRPPVGDTTPLLFVSDVDQGVRFYVDKLGFRINFEHKSDSGCGKYISVVRGGADFHVTNCECEDRGHVGKLHVRISAGPVDALHEEFKNAGVSIHREPTDEPWGLREFELHDPDGNRLIFWGFIPD